ncbi:MAG: 5-deoxy-glucuronate isomerase [Candidatus Latescibacterota bacterium]|nr:MAG: 5-deoxy-glucuronate isomerase [Candidatus Latescibacterota bacterium]
MSLHIRKQLSSGYNTIIGSEDKRLEFIEFGILRLVAGEKFTRDAEEKETVLVILTGRCTVKVGRNAYESIGQREDVFSGSPYSVYIPCGKSYEVIAMSNLEMAVCKAPSDLKTEPRLIRPEQVRMRSVGRLNWRRDIRDIVDSSLDARHLLIGETINPPGNWSSVPPHRHDFDNLPEESNMEEVYFFKLEPQQGFGIQRIYTDDRSIDSTYVLQNDDTVVIPEGYHPVVAAPGYRLYYLWILAGEKRILRMHDDPQHAWLKNAEPILEELGM